MSSIRRPTLRSVLTPAVLAIALALPGAAAAHPERGTKFPDPHTGSVPNFRT
ncbi:MAG: hypothetical protein QOK04_399, partial [Solirubrobacteraceae bacterium]|nr:hypothetical protein [Solirubrobacteraceae bacterium]